MKRKKRYAKTSVPGVTRILILNSKGQWQEPVRGGKFQTSKYIISNGERTRHRATFSTFAEAKAFKFEQTKIATQDSSEVTFDELVERWKNSILPQKDFATQIGYLKHLKHFEFFHGRKVREITAEIIDQWLALLKSPEYLARGRKSRFNYRHEYSSLRAILRYYETRIDSSYKLPFLPEHLQMLKVREKPVVEKDLSVQEFQSFIAALKKVCIQFDCLQVYYLALIQYGTYARIQEAAALRYEDFDLENKKVFLVKKVKWLRTKGFPDLIADGSKSNAGKVISLSDIATRAFLEWTMLSGIRSGHLFCPNGKIISYSLIKNRYNQALKVAGVQFTATHLLRHASITEHYEAKGDILATASVAGHSNIKTTQRYAKTREKRLQEIQTEVDQKFLQFKI